MKTIAITLSTCASIIFALYWGRVLSLVLPTVFPLLNRKPFNCRPCTTFHLTWFFIAGVSFATGQCWLAMVGVAIAFIVFAMVRHIDNKKIVK